MFYRHSRVRFGKRRRCADPAAIQGYVPDEAAVGQDIREILLPNESGDREIYRPAPRSQGSGTHSPQASVNAIKGTSIFALTLCSIEGTGGHFAT